MLHCISLTCGAGIGTVAGYLYGTKKGGKTHTMHIGDESSKKDLEKTLADVEQSDARWLNSIISVLWPRVDSYLKCLVEESIEPSVNAALPSKLQGSVKFEKVTLGQAAPKFGPIQVKQPEEGEILLQIGMDLTSELVLEIKACGIPIGVNKIVIRGTVNVMMRPPADKPPFFGGLEIYLVDPPELDLDFTGAANVADCPGLRGIIMTTIANAVNNIMVLPARIAVDMIHDEVDYMHLRYPEPRGVLVLALQAGHNLKACDAGIMGLGEAKTSDPYVIVERGQEKWTSPYKSKTLSPQWTESNVSEFLIYSMEQHLSFRVFDKDNMGDDLMGSARASVKELISKPSALVPLLFDGSPVGELRVSATLHTLQHEQPATPLKAPSNIILSAKIFGVEGLPETGRPPYTLHITAGKDKQRQCKTSGSHVPAEKAVKPLANELAQICLALANKKMPIEEIASVVNVSTDGVKLTIDSQENPEAAKLHVEKVTKLKAATQPAFDQIVYMLLSSEDENVYLQLFDAKSKPVGDPVKPIPLEELIAKSRAKSHVSGPFPLGGNARLAAELHVNWLQK